MIPFTHPAQKIDQVDSEKKDIFELLSQNYVQTQQSDYKILRLVVQVEDQEDIYYVNKFDSNFNKTIYYMSLPSMCRHILKMKMIN